MIPKKTFLFSLNILFEVIYCQHEIEQVVFIENDCSIYSTIHSKDRWTLDYRVTKV